MSVVVTGGTGTSGRALVPALRAAGHDIRVLSRRPGPDRIELVAAGPAGRMIQFGGPQVRPVDELARAWPRGTGRSRGALPVPLPGGWPGPSGPAG